MKKILLATVAAGALAFGGAASAQDLGSVIANEILSNVLGTNILGYGYSGTPSTTPQYTYRDEYGRLWVVEQGGRHVMIAPGTESGLIGYDAYGRPLASNNAYYRDSDGDGVADIRDRRPYDPHRW